MGNLKLVKIDKSYTNAMLEGTNSILALRMKESHSDIKKPVDFYLCGILAGGAEVLVNKPSVCIETECMGKGDAKCVYQLKEDKLNLKHLKKIHKLNEYQEKISKYYLSKVPFMKVSLDKKFDLKDGAFFLGKYEGYDIELYLVLLLDMYLRENYQKIYEEALYNMFSENLKIVLPEHLDYNINTIAKVLNAVQVFGYGSFQVKHGMKNNLFLESQNSVFGTEYKIIFNEPKLYSDLFTELFLKNLMEKVFGKKSEVKTVSSLGKHDKSSVFQVEFK
jgi:hypothetical protein